MVFLQFTNNKQAFGFGCCCIVQALHVHSTHNNMSSQGLGL